MKAKKTEIPQGCQLYKYMPANYSDSFGASMEEGDPRTPDDILIAFWIYQPGWVKSLFKLRNLLVKFVGLKSGEDDVAGLEKIIRNGTGNDLMMVTEKTEDETILKLTDKHLDAYMSVFIGDISNGSGGKQLYVSTLVKMHNDLGRFYFFFIRPFHNLIAKGTIKHILKNNS